MIRLKELVAHWNKLQAEARECALISDRTTDTAQRELFAWLADQLDELASAVARVITAQTTKEQSAKTDK
jgi:hypothetical protein